MDENLLFQKTLKLVKLFAGFSEQDARDFLTWAKRIDVGPGEVVIHESEPGQDMFIVASGSVLVVKSLGANEEQLAVLEAGDSFGEVAMLDAGPRSASVVCLTDAVLLQFERRHLVKLPSVSLKLYRNIAGMVATRLRDTSTRVMLAKASAGPDPDEYETHTRLRPVRRTVRSG